MKFLLKLFLITISIATLVLFFTQSKSSIHLDNAYVSGRVLRITATGDGILQENTLKRGTFIKKGTLLYLIDTTNWQLEIERLTEELRNVIKQEQLACLDTRIEVLLLELELVNLNFNERVYNRAKILSQVKAYSEADLDELYTNVKRSKVASKIAEQQIEIAKFANKKNPIERAEVKLILAKLKQAFYQKSNYKIRAPYDGYIYEIYSYPGQKVDEGDKLLTFIPYEKLLIEANALESEIKDLALGTEVIIKPDVYLGKVELKGKIESLVPSTAATFSGIPRNNTDSNWIKVAQRVPVLISVSQNQIHDLQLPIGSSVEVELPIPNNGGVARAAKTNNSTVDEYKNITSSKQKKENDFSKDKNIVWLKQYNTLINRIFSEVSLAHSTSKACVLSGINDVD
ncbi:MAG: HlyD family efflux transporter periplasmic adaptor subunit [Colwellia sp.]